MNNDEAKIILKTMSSLFYNVPFNKDDPDSLKIYMNQLIELDYQACSKALDDLVKTNKFCPSIAEIRERYLSIKKNAHNIAEMNYKNTCKVCNNKGFIVLRKFTNEYIFDDVKLPLTYIAYCDMCEKGNQYKYDGSNNEKYASKYHLLPISQYKSEEIYADHI